GPVTAPGRPGTRGRPGRALPHRSRSWPERQGRWGLAWAVLIRRVPALVLVLGIAVLAVIALPATGMRLGLPGNESQPASSTQHQSYDLLAQGFGPGFNATLAVVVDASGIPAASRAGVVRSAPATSRAAPRPTSTYRPNWGRRCRCSSRSSSWWRSSC
ncbi:MAG TPA: hypothetical protein VGD91_22310, partial [Trebonia sp.]